MTAITIKKEDFKNINDDICIHIYKEVIQSNVLLDSQKMIELPKENGWKVSGFKKVNSSLF
jgi:hypothetical protein